MTTALVDGLDIARLDDVEVWRVGFGPQPWAWVGWEWATDGRFHGRWDDRKGNFRTVYAGATLYACLIELLADFRPDPALLLVLDDIEEDDVDAALHPTASAGKLDPSWLTPRAAGTGRLTGSFCRITTAQTLAALHSTFVAQALLLGLRDFDAAALKDARARKLTQAISTYVYEHTSLDGLQFSSRHGDDLTLWAIYERPSDADISSCLGSTSLVELDQAHPDVVAAMEVFGLTWA